MSRSSRQRLTLCNANEQRAWTLIFQDQKKMAGRRRQTVNSGDGCGDGLRNEALYDYHILVRVLL